VSTFTTPKLARGVAGALVASTSTSHEGEPDTVVRFHGSTYGGPVVMAWGDSRTQQTFVSEDTRGRIGFPFHTDPVGWVRAFFTGGPGEAYTEAGAR
jgi:hypothetical protein